MDLGTIACAAAMLATKAGVAHPPVATALVPRVDHHQHLLSPALAAVWSEPAAALEPVTAEPFPEVRMPRTAWQAVGMTLLTSDTLIVRITLS